MSLTGKSAKSHKKQDLLNQKSPASGFKCLRFAHKATAGDTGFSINALVTPTEMASLGFSQPTPAELQAVNLQFYKKNLILASSARGLLQEALDFVVAANGQINFSPEFGTALADEIFVGTIDPIVRTGSLMADTVFILETGSLAANTTDIPVGRSFKTNENPSMQLGAVTVMINGQTLLRNVGNATAAPSADGDYQEVDNGSGASNLIRLNNSDSSARPYIVVSTQLSTVRSDGSLQEDLNRQQATIDLIVDTLAVLAGVPSTDFQAAPTQPLLRQFGDRVVTLEGNRARIDQSNSWTAYQQVPGRTDGVAVPAGYVGEELIGSVNSNSVALTSATNVTVTSVTLTPGVWDLSAIAGFTPAATTTVTAYHVCISKTTNSLGGTSSLNYGFPNAAGEVRFEQSQASYTPNTAYVTVAMTPYRVIVTTNTTFYLVLTPIFATSTMNGGGTIRAVRVA